MSGFIDEIAKKYSINKESVVYSYLAFKTKASDRGSKARRSLGNLYALYVLCEDFVNNNKEGSRFSDLMYRMRQLKFGSKLQNHPLDNRLNDEVRRRYALPDNLLPVQALTLNGAKARKISIDFLSQSQISSINAANFILEVINTYVSIIDQNQNLYLNEIQEASSNDELREVILSSFEYQADARLFEIVSHALLYLYLKKQSIFIGSRTDNLKEEPLTLYKTGRTNANDGGIDFVLQPIGKFYQVTETLEFKKYFLDFDKMNRFPISFVIKTDLTPHQVKTKIYNDASQKMEAIKVQRYMNQFDEIITLNELRGILEKILLSADSIRELKETIISSFKLEYGMLD